MTQPLTFETARIEHRSRSETGVAPDSSRERLDRYELIEPLNAGGFAMVFRGYDPLIKRPVAVKKCASMQPDVRDRFAREAEIVGKLDHPAIVRLFDFGIAEGVPFLVQELLDGEDLSDRIDRGPPVPLRRRLEILRSVAEGLAHAHDQGVVHRDIKPSNIRLLADDSIRILDFGVAALKESPSDLTRTGTTVGTAAYLAPEQIQGTRPTFRTDVYSFGVVAYELFTGVRPFEGDTLSALLYRIAHTRPQPVRTHSPELPAELARLVHRCLARGPERRPPDLHGVAAELDQLLADPRLAKPSSDTVPIPLPDVGPLANGRQGSLAELPIAAPRPPARRSSAAIPLEGGQLWWRHRLLPGLATLLALGLLAAYALWPAPQAWNRLVDGSVGAGEAVAGIGASGGIGAIRGIRATRPWARYLAAGQWIGAWPSAWLPNRVAGRLPPEAGRTLTATVESRLGALLDTLSETGLDARRAEFRSQANRANPAIREDQVPDPSSTAPFEPTASSNSPTAEPGEPSPSATRTADRQFPPEGEGATGADPSAATPALATSAPGSAETIPAGAPVPATGGSATLLIRPSWDPRMTVSIDGGPFQPLNTRRVFELPAREHTVTFALQTPTYSVRRSVQVGLAPGAAETLESPIGPPAAVVVAVVPDTAVATIDVDGTAWGQAPTERRLLAPGRVTITVRPPTGDPLGPFSKPVELRSATSYRLVFDLRRRRADLETLGTASWDG